MERVDDQRIVRNSFGRSVGWRCSRDGWEIAFHGLARTDEVRILFWPPAVQLFMPHWRRRCFAPDVMLQYPRRVVNIAGPIRFHGLGQWSVRRDLSSGMVLGAGGEMIGRVPRRHRTSRFQGGVGIGKTLEVRCIGWFTGEFPCLRPSSCFFWTWFGRVIRLLELNGFFGCRGISSGKLRIRLDEMCRRGEAWSGANRKSRFGGGENLSGVVYAALRPNASLESRAVGGIGLGNPPRGSFIPLDRNIA